MSGWPGMARDRDGHIWVETFSGWQVLDAITAAAEVHYPANRGTTLEYVEEEYGPVEERP